SGGERPEGVERLSADRERDSFMHGLRRRMTAVGVQRAMLIGLAGAVLSGIGIWVFERQSGQAKPTSLPTASATRGDLLVAVGGVGRLVEATASSAIGVPAAAGSSTSPGAAPVAASPDAVFARATGRLSKFLVSPGRRVAAGQALAVLDDGGNATNAVNQ